MKGNGVYGENEKFFIAIWKEGWTFLIFKYQI
jgi:hypothetical protein